MSQSQAVERHTAAPARTGDEQYDRKLARLEREIGFLAGSSLLADSHRFVGSGQNKRPRPKEEIQANLAAIGLDFAARGIPFTLSTVNQAAVVNGRPVLMAQLLIGLADRHGYDLQVPESTDEKATVVLKRRITGETWPVTYTIEQARKTPTFRNDVWKEFPSDMLVWRAVRRAVRRGAPAIAAGFGLPEEDLDQPHYDWQPVNPETDDASRMQALPESPPEHIVQAVKDDGRRVMRLQRAINRLPAAWKNQLADEWVASRLPPMAHDDFRPAHLDAAEDLVDRITAEAFERPPEADGEPAQEAEPNKAVDLMAALEASLAAAKKNAAEAADEFARPLAQQIAMQAKDAGVDHHHVIQAATGGKKASARDVTPLEGRLVLEAIATIAEDKLALVERDGEWIFADPPAPEQADMWDESDPGRPFE